MDHYCKVIDRLIESINSLHQDLSTIYYCLAPNKGVNLIKGGGRGEGREGWEDEDDGGVEGWERGWCRLHSSYDYISFMKI